MGDLLILSQNWVGARGLQHLKSLVTDLNFSPWLGRKFPMAGAKFSMISTTLAINTCYFFSNLGHETLN